MEDKGRVTARCLLCGGVALRYKDRRPITLEHKADCPELARLNSDEDPCTGGCGMPAKDCICPLSRWAPEPWKTMTQRLREIEAEIWADPEARGMTREAWARVAQWPDPNEEK